MKEELQKHWALVAFSALYILGFTVFFVLQRDFEFLLYVGVLIVFAALIAGTLHITRFDWVILWGLSLWGFLHVIGGGVSVEGTVLYGITVIPIAHFGGELTFVKYDQLVHLYGFAVATLVVYHLLRPYLGRTVHLGMILVITALAGMGLGVVNEIVEFIAVLVFPETGVGGYHNTALDLVFNTIGAIIAAFYIGMRREKQVYAERDGMVAQFKTYIGIGKS